MVLESKHEHTGCCVASHSHHEHEESNVRAPVLIILSAILLAASFFIDENLVLLRCIILTAYLLCGFPVLKEAFENIIRGEVFDECFLMSLASIGALAIGEWQEAAAVMVLYQFGEYLQDKAVDTSRRSITDLMNVRPDTASVLRNGVVLKLPAEDVALGETILVKPGERIPLDSTVIEGSSSLNTAALTGESLPLEVQQGSKVLSGCVNMTGSLKLRVDKSFQASAASRILELVEEASDKKARTETFISRFARVYTPAVIAIAIAVAVFPPLFSLGTWREYFYRALNFLVISCPCALVISVPLTYFAGLGCASRNGILIKGSNYMDVLSKVEIAAFDKTGTLTKGEFSLAKLYPANGISEEKLFELAAYAEFFSNHPLAKSIMSAYSDEIDRTRVSEMQETAGHGTRCRFDERILAAGKPEYLSENGISVPDDIIDGTVICVAYDSVFQGRLLMEDREKADSSAALEDLKKLGIERTVILSGDRQSAVRQLAEKLCISDFQAELMPSEKVEYIEQLHKALKSGTLLYAGDGINDAPVLALSDVGVAMGALGTDAAMEAADVVIMGDELTRIPLAIRISRRTARVARSNIALALTIKALIMILAALGYTGLWVAVFADVGVCLLAILNALRAMNI